MYFTGGDATAQFKIRKDMKKNLKKNPGSSFIDTFLKFISEFILNDPKHKEKGFKNL